MNYTEATATVELGGDERDVQVRAYVERSRDGYRIDGDVEALIDGEWMVVMSASPLDLRIIDEAICDAAESSAPDFGTWDRRSA